MRVAVIGGGITGLAAAYFLQQLRHELGDELSISLFEKSSRLGGVIRSERRDGMLLEAGPEGWASYKPWAKKLAFAVGLKDSLSGSRDEFRKTLIVRNGRLTALPDGMMFLAPIDPVAFWRTAPLSVLGKMRASFEPLVPRSRGDLSVKDFFQRRLGREFTDKLVEPLISAIYGGDFEKLSAPGSLPELHRAEQRTGSLWKGLRPFARISLTVSVLYTMKEGMEQLPQKVAANLPQESLVLNADPLSIESRREGYVVRTPDHESLFDSLILATPAPATADLLAPFAETAAAELREVPYGSSILVYLAYRRSEFSHPLDGFGFVVPRRENLRISACTWVNTKFANRCPDDRVLLRCAIHSADGQSTIGDDQAVEAAHRETSKLLGTSCQPIMAKVLKATKAMPQFLVGHHSRIQKVRDLLASQPGLYLAGSFAGGVGVPDCIRTAEDTVQRIKQALTGEAPAPSTPSAR